MAVIDMTGIIAVMGDAATSVTDSAGNAYTMPAYQAFSTVSGSATITGGNLLIMRNAHSAGGKPIQVFNVDEVIAL